MVISAYSNRIYKNKLSYLELESIDSLLKDCNDIKIKLYNDIVSGKLNIDLLNTTYIINHFGVNTYFANMIIKKVKEAISSNKELQSFNIESKEQKIKETKEKEESIIKKIEFLRKLKLKCIEYTKNKKLSSCFVFPYYFINNNGTITVKTSKNNKGYLYNLYDFEISLNLRIKRLKSNLVNVKNKLNRLNRQLINLKEKPHISCFGNKSFFKKQFTVDTYIKDHDKWLKEFRLKRHSNFVITGSKNHEGGSMCARYDNTKNILSIMSYKLGTKKEGSKYLKSLWLDIPVTFKYNTDKFLNAYKSRNTIAYQIIDKGDYYIIKASFEEENRLNTYIGDGIVAIDINVDCFALCNINKDGCFLNSKVIRFNLNNKSSNETTKIIEEAVCEVFNYCNTLNKPLVRENIKNTKFKKTNDKKKNKVLTQFAYDKMINAIDRKFYKNGIAVFKTNPIYTSQMGKLLYMAKLGLSIHESASYCIGRRFLLSTYEERINSIGKRYIVVTNLFYEDLSKYKRFGTIKTVSKKMNKLKIKDFYRLEKIPIKIEDYKKLDKYVTDVKDYFKKEEESNYKKNINNIEY